MTRAHDATAAAITHTAAQLLARHQNPTVGAVAQATGVVRGTVYRYLPTRHALLTAVLDQALLQVDHHLTRPPCGRGGCRPGRRLAGVGAPSVLSGQGISAFSPVEALLDRGCRTGDLRSDIPLSFQAEALYALVHASLRASELDMGAEE